MRRIHALLLCALALPPALAHAAGDAPVSTAPSDSRPATPTDPEARYQALLAAAKASAPYADWAGLRLAFADRPGFRLTGQAAEKGAMFKAVEAADCDTALSEAKAVIAAAFVDADAHLITAYCEEKAGDGADAAKERDIGLGLLRSIQTGDGRSTTSPFTVIDVDEEYALMRALGLKVTGQALVQQGGHSFDAITASDDKGASATYYFLIDRVLAAEAAMLKPGAVSEGGPPDRSP